jgi:Gpi18-like mannosyltransferase
MRQLVAALHRIRSSIQPERFSAKYLMIVLVLIGVGLAILIRIPLLPFQSVDYFNERVQAYPVIKAQGFAALASSASNYNPPYFYLIYLITRALPNVPMVVAVKLPAIIADFACALFVYLIVSLKFTRGPVALLAGFAVLFAPTVIANSAFWGQVDSIHSAAVLACVYFLMRRQYTWALLAFAVALSFKLQAIFLAPLLLALWLRGQIRWQQLLLVPAVLFLALIPAWMAGRPLPDLLTIYLRQSSQFESITMNAPTAYAWVPGDNQFFRLLYSPALIMGATMAFLLALAFYKAPRRFTAPLLLELALLTVLVVPFFLPKMHERYFFIADVLSIAFVMYYPQFFFVPIAIIGVSSLSYLPFLFNVEVVPLPVLALVLLLVISILAYHAFRQLYSPEEVEPGRLGAASPIDVPGPVRDAA